MVWRRALSLVILVAALGGQASAQCPCGPGCYCGPGGQCICPGISGGFASYGYSAYSGGFPALGGSYGYGWSNATSWGGMACSAPAPMTYYGGYSYSYGAPAVYSYSVGRPGLFGRRWYR